MKLFKKPVDSVSSLSSKLADLGMAAGAVCVFAMTLLVTVDVIGRHLFNSPILGTDHLAAYLLVALTFLGLSYTLKTGAHIKVDVIIRHLPQTINDRLEMGAYVVAIMGTAVFLWHSLWMVLSAYTMGKVSSSVFEEPAYLVQLFLPLGFSFLFLELVVEFLGKIRRRH